MAARSAYCGGGHGPADEDEWPRARDHGGALFLALSVTTISSSVRPAHSSFFSLTKRWLRPSLSFLNNRPRSATFYSAAAYIMEDKYIGLILAICGSVGIGSSFIITKKVLGLRVLRISLSKHIQVL